MHPLKRRFQMNPQSKKQIINGLLMSGAMSIALAGLFTWMNFGFTTAWLQAWLNGVLIGWPVAFILAAVIGKPLSKLADRLAS